VASEARKRRGRVSRSSIVLRWLAVGALALVAFLYYRPLKTYFETRERVDAQSAQVTALRARKHALERRVAAATSTAAMLREARRLSFVKPDERLFIVKGVRAWEKAHAQNQSRER
jgi:cell division protein FtsB